MMQADAAAEALRQAWDALPPADTFAGRMARRSLEASAKQDPALESVLFELQHQSQAELDLHLDGPRVAGHATSAIEFANLVRGISEAVKELTKSALGRDRMVPTLQILAPSPGSVRVVLQPVPPAEEPGAFKGTATETRESKSLVQVATILARAGAGASDSDAVLDGLTAGVPVGAHAGLRRAAKAVVAAQWSVAGVLRQAGGDPLEIAVDSAGANRLLSALEARTEEEQQLTVQGHIDGQRRSLSAMWFVPAMGAAFEAAVPDPTVLAQVATLAATDEVVSARFDVVIRSLSGSSGGARRSYSLRSISPVTPHAVLPIEDRSAG
jgi:hypothetical protein